MTNGSSNQVRRFSRFAGLIFAVAASIALFHFSVKGILANLQSTGQTLEMAARDDEHNDYHVACCENWNSPFADYSYAEMSRIFTDFSMFNGTGFDTANFVQCWAKRSSVVYTSEQIEDSVVFLGGSIPYGKGTPNRFLFQEVIQRIAVDNNGEPVKTIDFTFEGKDFTLALEKFLSLVRMNPRSIVYVWSPADTPFFSLDPPLAFENSSYWDQPNHFLSKNGNPEAQLFKGAWKLFQDRRDLTRWIKTINSTANMDGMEYFLSSIKSMQAEASATGVDFRVVLFPLMEGRRNHYEFADIHEKMMSLLTNNDIPNIDLVPALFGSRPQELRINTVNIRPNVEAHRRAAIALAPFLGLHAKETYLNSGSADMRIRRADIPDEKYALTEGSAFCALIFFLLLFLLFSCVVAFALHIPLIMRDIEACGLKTILSLLLIITYAALLRMYVSPHAHLVLGDEYDRLRIVELWIAGVFGAHTYNVFPGAMAAYYPAYLLFGLHSQVGFNFSVFMNTISCFILFLVVKSAFKKNGVALTATLLLATFPVCLRFSGSHAAEIPNLLFMLVCVYALMQSRTNRSFLSSFLFFSSLSFFVFIRIHNIAFAAFILCCYMSFNYGRASSEDGPRTSRLLSKIFASAVRTRADIFPAIIFVFSLVCCLIMLYISATIGDYSRNIQTFIMIEHLSDNMRFFVSNKYLPFIYTIICCVPIILIFFKRHTVAGGKTILFMALWLIIYFICHLQAQSGLYLRSAESVRHTLDFAAPLLIMTALGIYFIDSILSGKIEKSIYRVSMFLFIALVPFSHMSEIRDKGYVDNVLRATLSVAGSFPKSAIFITNTMRIHDAIDMDLRAVTRLAYSPRDASRICATEQECFLILYKNDQDEDFELIRNLCPDSIRYIHLEVAICPFDKLSDIPAGHFHPPSFETGGGDYVSNLPYGMNIEMRSRNKAIKRQ
jgi:hypothetical protein